MKQIQVSLAALFLFASAAHGATIKTAQSDSATQAPQSTSATYDAWQLRCETRQSGEQAKKVCQVVQAITVKGQQQPVVQIVVWTPEPGASLRLVLQLPMGVWLPVEPKFTISVDGTATGVSFKRCTPGGCIATADLTPENVKAIEGLGEAEGTLVFQMVEGTDVKVPISFKGFLPAYNAMQSATN